MNCEQQIVILYGGYVRRATFWSRALGRLRIVSSPTPRGWHRVAIIFEPLAGMVDLTIDHQLFLETIHECIEMIDHDEGLVFRGGSCSGKLTPESSMDALTTFDHEPDYPDRIELRRSGRLIGILEIEEWAQIGGPAPYHDSYALALHTPENINSLVARLIRDVANKHGAKVRDHQAS